MSILAKLLKTIELTNKTAVNSRIFFLTFL